MLVKEAINLDWNNSKPQKDKITQLTVSVSASLTNKIYQYVISSQKDKVSPYGFQKNDIPLGYIEQNYKLNIVDHLKEFIFKYLVVNFLYKELRKNKIIVVGDPRLIDVIIAFNKPAEFHFEITTSEQINNIEDWRYVVFRPSKRKNYKDLDKQAIAFIKEEQTKKKENDDQANIEIGDWVCFNLCVVNENKVPVLENFDETLWLKIGDDEPSIPFQELFLGKKKGDIFCTNALCLQEYFDNQINADYIFCLEIKDVINKTFFSIDYLKEHFRLKANKAIHQKMIEVFSFRNDLSLRKVIVEEFFDLFFVKLPFDAPLPAILRQQKEILDVLQINPDYPVYRMQRDFDDRVRSLATRQVKEKILIDAISYAEEIEATHNDIKYYLNLANRPRTKEFIYFQHPIIKANEQEYPLPTELLIQDCLREKTLNYVIHYLTRD